MDKKVQIRKREVKDDLIEIEETSHGTHGAVGGESIRAGNYIQD